MDGAIPAAAMDEYLRLSAALRSARARGADGADEAAALERHMIEHGMGDGGLDPDAVAPAEPAPGADVVVAAALAARAAGDTGTADALEAALDRPAEVAALVAQLSGDAPTG